MAGAQGQKETDEQVANRRVNLNIRLDDYELFHENPDKLESGQPGFAGQAHSDSTK
ncbi:hypothetical protein KW783_01560 [Candidatus Parcubacteria bacterium]|nr:hypothetical protein [Candidatus Parcubacteria bacterium]